MVQAQSLTATLVYTYNADGLRVAQSQSVSSVQSVDTFTWDWATGVPELLSDGDSLYLIGYDTLGWQTGTDWTFVLPDALGSVRQETDATGAVTAVREWSPYGEELGGAQTGLGFTGEWYDVAVGMTYLRARWYAEKNGSFISPDFITPNFYTPQSLNVYVYVLENPIRFTDPSGNVPYDRDAAVDYAQGWYGGVNSIYGTFGDKDCTNFVSQALLAGGFPQDEMWFFETNSESGTPSRCNDRCCTSDLCKFFRRSDTATCGNAWTLTDELYEYLTQEKGFDRTPLEGTQEPTGLDAYGEKSGDESTVLPWASDLDEKGFWRTETLGPISEKVKEGDVVFYRQDHASDVRSGKSDFNHAAFVVGFGMQTRRGAVEYVPPYAQTPYIVDHSSGFSKLGRRAINDTTSEVNRIVIVHIPDDIPEPEKPWCGCP